MGKETKVANSERLSERASKQVMKTFSGIPSFQTQNPLCSPSLLKIFTNLLSILLC